MQPQGDLAGNWLNAAQVPWDLLKQGVAGSGSPAEDLFNMLGADMPQAEPVPFDQQMLDVMTASSPVKIPTVGGLWAGRNAKHVNLNKMFEASQMQGAGVPTKEIRAKTGFFGGLSDADPELRWEIADRPAKLNADVLEVINGHKQIKDLVDVPLVNVIDHSEAYKNYGDKLGQVKVSTVDGSGGNYNDEFNRIRIGADQSLKNIRETMLHEMQHRVQYIEGFPRGGNPNMWGGPTFSAFRNARDTRLAYKQLKYWRNKIATGKKLFSHRGTKELLDKHNDIFSGLDLERSLRNHSDPFWTKHIDKMIASSDDVIEHRNKAMSRYMNLAGEGEAREIEFRSNMTSEQLKANEPGASLQNPGGMEVNYR